MSQNAIIVNTPQTQNQSDAQDWASLFNAIIGDVSGVLTYGNELEVEKVNDNTIKIKDGVYSLQGHIMRVPEGKDVELTVNSGTLGVERIDLLVIKYEKNVNNQKDDTFEFEVVQGDAIATNDGEPTPPSITQNDLLEGGTKRQEVLYELHLNETTLSLVDKRQFVTSVRNLEDRVEDEFVDQGSRISALQSKLQIGPSIFEMIVQGYGNGNVINGLELAKNRGIYLLFAGRWNAIWIISHDPGDDTLAVNTVINQYPNYTVSVDGMKLTLNSNSNAPYILYRVK